MHARKWTNRGAMPTLLWCSLLLAAPGVLAPDRATERYLFKAACVELYAILDNEDITKTSFRLSGRKRPSFGSNLSSPVDAVTGTVLLCIWAFQSGLSVLAAQLRGIATVLAQRVGLLDRNSPAEMFAAPRGYTWERRGSLDMVALVAKFLLLGKVCFVTCGLNIGPANVLSGYSLPSCACFLREIRWILPFLTVTRTFEDVKSRQPRKNGRFPSKMTLTQGC